MTRRDFELIAAVLGNTSGVEVESRVLLAEAFASALGSTNPRFDRERFVRACLSDEDQAKRARWAAR